MTASRCLLTSQTCLIVDALGPHLAPGSGPPSGSARAVLMPDVAASAAALDEISTFAAVHGIAIEAATAADSAWAAALGGATQGASTGIVAVQVVGTQPHVRLLGVSKGAPSALRRLPLHADPSLLVGALGSVAGALAEGEREGVRPPLLSLGDAAFREVMGDVARAVGLIPVDLADERPERDHTAEAVAATHAGAGPRFVPPSVRAAATRRNRRRGVLAAVGAVALLLAAGALDTLDLRRELEAARELRRAHAGEVAVLMDVRTRIEDLATGAADLDSRRREHPRWTLLLSALAEGVPPSARLTSLRTAGDSVVLEIESSDAATAFDAVREIPWLSGFRAVAPVQREIGDASVLTERLTASATVAWPELNGAGGGSR